MTRRTISLLVLALSIAAVILIAPDVALIVFAGILLAILIHGSGHWIADKFGGHGLGRAAGTDLQADASGRHCSIVGGPDALRFAALFEFRSGLDAS
jgi:hypothetical protein